MGGGGQHDEVLFMPDLTRAAKKQHGDIIQSMIKKQLKSPAPEQCDDSCKCDKKATHAERLACHADIDKAECDKCHSECDQKQGADAETCIKACDAGSHCSNGMDKAAATACKAKCEGIQSMMACINHKRGGSIAIKAGSCTSCATCLAGKKGKSLKEMLHEMSKEELLEVDGHHHGSSDGRR